MDALGVDIGGTHLRAARVDSSGRILAEARKPCDPRPDALLADVLALVAGLRGPETGALGIGVPCRVDAGTGETFVGGYVDLTGFPFAARIEAETGLVPAIENDATMALIAEHAVGAARGHDAAVMMTVGTGIGGAILEGGRPVRGRRSAGQLGHLQVGGGDAPCPCGRRGCLETLSSGRSLAAHVGAAGLPEGTRAEALLASDDPRAQAVLAAWAGPMARAIGTLSAALQPEVVVLGGGAGAAMVEALGRLPLEASPWFAVPVVPAALGDAAGVIGAALAGFSRAGAGRRRALLVNGVPASGKSGVARALSRALGWPLLTLDTVKAPFLQELPPGDRPFNRTLGRAAYAAIWDTLAAAPDGTGVVIDAWFGFQSLDLLDDGLARAGVGAVAEVWCEAPPDEIARRYAARVAERGPGHPGLDYVPELVALAARAQPTGRAPVLRVDTTRPLDLPAVVPWARAALAGAATVTA